MKQTINNAGEADYDGKLKEIADKLKTWQDPIVLISHVDPDGDALGSTLALKRALDSLGKTTSLAMDVPSYLKFITKEGEIRKELEQLPEKAMLVVLDVDVGGRSIGAPLDADFVINIDHHGSNQRVGDICCVQPSKAATAQMVKDLLDMMQISWTADIATPCLTGIVTDTGRFAYANTTPDVLQAASELIAHGVDYTSLADRLQWRHPNYFKMLGLVMSNVEFPYNGLIALAHITTEMEESIDTGNDDSSDYVGLIRYAEGTKIAIFLKGREDHTKVSIRTRDGVSAQAIAYELGGGGHVPAAGAKLNVPLEEAKPIILEAARKELERQGLV